MTKDPPATPIKRRNTARLVALLMVPVMAVGILAKQRTQAKGMRAPNLSHMGPRMKRMAMVPPTPTIDEVQISSLLNPRVVLISDKRGAMANQTKKAKKKPNHCQGEKKLELETIF